MSVEVQTCPDRINQFGPWEHKEGLDQWESDRWTTSEEEVVQRKKQQDPEGTTHWGPWNYLWVWSWGPPRTCSFCGGIHPEDAIRLVQEGWEVEGTGKNYKRYLNPPGTQATQEACSAAWRSGHTPEPVKNWLPTPPVKVYVSHFSEDQVNRFNIAMRKPTPPQ